MIPKIRPQIMACLVTLALCSLSIKGALADDLLNAMQTRYDDLHVAILGHDDKTIATTIDPDYQEVDTSGKTKSRDQWIAEINSIPKDIKKVTKTTVLSAFQEGETITVKQHYEMSTKKYIQGATRALDVEAFSTDTWVVKDEKFILKRSATDEISVKIDGVLINHQKARNI